MMLFVLSLVYVLKEIAFSRAALKQQFNELIGKVKQIEIKNRSDHFYNDITNIKEFNSSLLKIDKKSCKDIDICRIGYITIKNNW